MADNKAPAFSAIIKQADLISVMGRVNNVVEKRNTIPILGYAKIEAKEGRVYFTASDLDIEIRDSIEPNELDIDGSIAVPAGVLYDIARKMPKGSDIQLISREHRIEISTGRSNFNLPTLPPENFPVMSKDDFQNDFRISCDAFKTIIDRTKFAMSTEETRYYLNGLYLVGQDGGDYGMLRAVATDGHRLALSQIDAPDGAQGMGGVIVPRKTVLEIRRLMETFPKDEDIQVKVSSNKIQFTIGDMVLTSKLIDGTFPDYDRVIPKNNEKIMTVDGKVFVKAIDRVATIAEGKTRSIVFDISKDNLCVKTTTSEFGSGQEEISVKYQDEDFQIGFNAKYLVDTIAQIESDKAEFHMDGPASPMLIKDPDTPGSLFVLMPLRV